MSPVNTLTHREQARIKTLGEVVSVETLHKLIIRSSAPKTLCCISFLVRLNKRASITLSLDFSHGTYSYQVGFELEPYGRLCNQLPHLPQPLDIYLNRNL